MAGPVLPAPAAGVGGLAEPEEPVVRLLDRAEALGPELGPVLLQLPPALPAALDRLERTLDRSSRRGVRVAFEARHPSWFAEATYAVLAGHGAALCLTDRRNRRGVVVRTTDWDDVRLPEGTGSPAPCDDRSALDGWAHTVAASGAREAWVFFDDDPNGCAVADAAAFARLAGRAGLEPTRSPVDPAGFPVAGARVPPAA